MTECLLSGGCSGVLSCGVLSVCSLVHYPMTILAQENTKEGKIMVKASRVMNVPAQALFDMLIESVIYDIKQSTGKTVRPANFKKGTNYRKRIKTNAKGQKGVSVKVTVTELESPRIYEAKFEGGNDSYTVIRYEIEQLSEEGDEDGDYIRVTYTEDYNDVSKMAKPVRGFQKLIAKNNFKRTLKGMEESVKENMKLKEERAAEKKENAKNGDSSSDGE